MAEKTKVSARDKAKLTDRDQTLINILERMVGQMQKQEVLLDEVVKHQGDYSNSMKAADYKRSAMLDETDRSLDRIGDAVSRYRSDMLSLVNEQDNINKNIDELRKLIKKSAYDQDVSNQRVANIDERLKVQEKNVHDHYEHSLKQSEVFSREIAESSRNVAKLHADTEKRLGELHRETQKQLSKLQQETSRRLLALDGMDAALQTLLIRTEPPEKKPFIVVRIFRSTGRFFRVKLPSAFMKLWNWESS